MLRLQLVSGVGMTHALSRSPDGEVLFGEDVTVWFVGFGVLTCVANLYSVGAIAYKAWYVSMSFTRSYRD